MNRKILISIFIFLIASSSYARIDYEAEITNFVSKLNEVFSLDIKTIKRDKGCGFAANLKFIVYCQKDIDVFYSLSPEEGPLESLLTIIGHEYAHILLDYDKTEVAQTEFKNSLMTVRNLIYELVKDDPRRLSQLERSTYRQSSIDLKDKISDFLGLTHHENVDALGAKLVQLTNLDPNPSCAELVMRFEEGQRNPIISTWIAPRKDILTTAKKDGFERWSNFNCIGNAFTFLDSNSALRKGLAKLHKDKFLQELRVGCTPAQAVENFFKRLDSYYP